MSLRLRTVAVRTDRGRLHLAMPVGRTYLTACGATLTGLGGRDLWLYTGRQRAKAWALELVCKRCDAKAAACATERALVKACGW